MSKRKPKPNEDAQRQNRARAAGELVGAIGGVAFKRFGFVQGAVVSRWPEIVGERYARASAPESIRFPAGKKEGGTLTLVVEGSHAPVMQHLAPTIVERVNRFFGHPAVARVQFRQGRLPRAEQRRTAPPEAKPRELGAGLREIGDPELKAVLESLAGRLDPIDRPTERERPNPLAIFTNMPKVR